MHPGWSRSSNLGILPFNQASLQWIAAPDLHKQALRGSSLLNAISPDVGLRFRQLAVPID